MHRSFQSMRSEIVQYLMFAALFSLVLSTFTLGNSFSFAHKLRERVLGPGENLYYGVLTIEDSWDYLTDVLVPSVFPVESELDPDTKNTMIGAMQLQQTRTNRNENCPVPPIYHPTIKGCYPSLRDAPASTNRFGREKQFEAVEIGLSPFTEWVFVQNVSAALNRSAALAAFEKLREQEWIDLETRIVNVLFTFYNPAIDMFCAVCSERPVLPSVRAYPASVCRV